jgi:CheY-like chemotaxis protein
VREALNENGVPGELVVIDDGATAIRYIEALDADSPAKCPDLAIIDLSLPKISGFEALKAIRQSVGCRDTIVVILSSSDIQSDRDKALRLGASRYFRKPLRLKEFMGLGAVFRNLLEAGASPS